MKLLPLLLNASLCCVGCVVTLPSMLQTGTLKELA